MRIVARSIQIDLEYGRIRKQSIRNAKRFIWNFLRFIGDLSFFAVKPPLLQRKRPYPHTKSPCPSRETAIFLTSERSLPAVAGGFSRGATTLSDIQRLSG